MYFRKIRTSIGKILLRSEWAGIRRQPKAFNLNQLSTILILVEIRTQDDIELVKKYINQLKDLQKKVRVIGWVDSAEAIEFNYSKIDFDLFNQKNLGTWMKPLGFLSENLATDEPDLLLDLNVNDKFPLTYLGTLSRAKFKVGKVSKANNITHDLTIEISSNNSIDYLYSQAISFLKMINNLEK